MTYRLAIDYGTTNSAAAISDLPEGEAITVFVNRIPTVPSVVGLARGILVAGVPAENAAFAYPASTARTPKRDFGARSRWG